MTKKIIILSRISTAPQSIESQTNDLIKEAERLGYDKEHQIIIETVESAIKLSEEERIGLQKLKYHIENDSEVDCVICWEPSRLSRQQKTLYSIRDYLVSHKIQLYILNPYMKLLTDDRTQVDTTANIVFALFATISENEMSIKKERFMRAKNELTKQGKKSAGAVIFGYMKDKEKNCVPHPLNSKIIIDLFNHYAENDSSLWETYQYATRNWPELFPIVEYIKGQHKIRHFFDTDYYYKGNWCYPPIISESLWNKVHDKMSKARCQPRYNTKLDYLGRGKVRCKECGNIMTGVGGNVKAYCCCTDKNHSLQINIDVMDWIIWEEVREAANIAASIDNSSKIIETNKQIKWKENEKEQIKQYIDDKTAKLDKLVALYLDDKIDHNIYNRRYEELNNDINDKQRQLELINIQIGELKNILEDDNITEVKPVLLDSITDFNIRLEYVRKYLKNVILSKQEDRSILVEFEWNMPLISTKSKYEYHFKGGRKKVYRINEDGTKDCIK